MSVAALLLAAGTASAGVEVRAQGELVDVRSTATPVSEVLDRLGRELGMKVVYESAPPRQALTLSLEGRTPAEAVVGILEGLGLNYALVMDATGTRVKTLMITGAASASAGPPPAPSRPAPAFVARPPVLQRELPEPDAGGEVDPDAAAEEEAAAEEGGEPDPDAEGLGTEPAEEKPASPPQPQVLPLPGAGLPSFGANPFPTPPPQPAQQAPKATPSPSPQDEK
jgi:hypothetical protein